MRKVGEAQRLLTQNLISQLHQQIPHLHTSPQLPRSSDNMLNNCPMKVLYLLVIKTQCENKQIPKTSKIVPLNQKLLKSHRFRREKGRIVWVHNMQEVLKTIDQMHYTNMLRYTPQRQLKKQNTASKAPWKVNRLNDRLNQIFQRHPKGPKV